MEIQPKLLRFLQEHAVMPVGSSTSRQVDVRIVAATNHDPGKAIASGQQGRLVLPLERCPIHRPHPFEAVSLERDMQANSVGIG